MYDPLKLADHARDIVCKDTQRKYYHFRPARFYGGIATADCLGCCLRFVFCWSWDKVIKPEHSGEYYTSGEVAGRLISVAKSKRYHQIRISG